MSIRVIQWGAGENGSALLRAVARHADLELVGCRVYSDAKNGVDAGVISGIAPLGIAATTDAQTLIDLDADIVLHCPRLTPDQETSDQDILALLRSGKNVISVSGSHSMPSAISAEYAARFEAACAEGGSTFAAAGINPGFIAERLAATLSGLCTDLDSLTVSEAFDSSRSTPDLLFNTMGFGKPLEEWSADSPVGRMFFWQFSQLINNLAHSLGMKLTSVRHSARVVPAHRDIPIGDHVVREGTVAAIVQRWEGVPEVEGDPCIAKETVWLCARDIPDYPPRSGWRVEAQGIPSWQLDLKLIPDGDIRYKPEAMVGAAIPVIAEVMAAPAGILLPRIFAPYRRRFLKEATTA